MRCCSNVLCFRDVFGRGCHGRRDNYGHSGDILHQSESTFPDLFTFSNESGLSVYTVREITWTNCSMWKRPWSLGRILPQAIRASKITPIMLPGGFYLSLGVLEKLRSIWHLTLGDGREMGREAGLRALYSEICVSGDGLLTLAWCTAKPQIYWQWWLRVLSWSFTSVFNNIFFGIKSSLF